MLFNRLGVVFMLLPLTVGRKLCKIAVLAATLAMFGSAHASSLPLKGETLNVGLSPVPPFVQIDGQFTDLEGIDVDIIRDLQRRTGFSIKNNRFRIMSFGELLSLGEQGFMDISAAAISLNADRAQLFDQSPASFRSHSVIVVPSGSSIAHTNDLIGKTIAAEEGTDATDIVSEDLAHKIKISHELSTFMTFYSVVTGKSDALITEAPMAMGAVNNWAKGRLKIAYHIKGSENDIGIMFKKGTKASKILCETFQQMRDDGTIAKIVHKYLPDYQFPEDLQPKEHKLASAQ